MHFALLEVKEGKRLGDVYALHQWLWRAWDRAEGESAPFLYRADRVIDDDGTSVLKVLVQSELPGNWERVKGQIASVEDRTAELAFAAGERLRFFLRANPTKSVKATVDRTEVSEGERVLDPRGTRVGVFGIEAQERWITRKLERCGAKVLGVRTSNERMVRWHSGAKKGTHLAVDFEGVLEVQDGALLVAGLRDGFGAAKAFGFGLLSVRKI